MNAAVKLSFGKDETSFEAKGRYALCCWINLCYLMAERTPQKVTGHPPATPRALRAKVGHRLNTLASPVSKGGITTLFLPQKEDLSRFGLHAPL